MFASSANDSVRLSLDMDKALSSPPASTSTSSPGRSMTSKALILLWWIWCWRCQCMASGSANCWHVLFCVTVLFMTENVNSSPSDKSHIAALPSVELLIKKIVDCLRMKFIFVRQLALYWPIVRRSKEPPEGEDW